MFIFTTGPSQQYKMIHSFSEIIQLIGSIHFQYYIKAHILPKTSNPPQPRIYIQPLISGYIGSSSHVFFQIPLTYPSPDTLRLLYVQAFPSVLSLKSASIAVARGYIAEHSMEPHHQTDFFNESCFTLSIFSFNLFTACFSAVSFVFKTPWFRCSSFDIFYSILSFLGTGLPLAIGWSRYTSPSYTFSIWSLITAKSRKKKDI